MNKHLAEYEQECVITTVSVISFFRIFRMLSIMPEIYCTYIYLDSSGSIAATLPERVIATILRN